MTVFWKNEKSSNYKILLKKKKTNKLLIKIKEYKRAFKTYRYHLVTVSWQNVFHFCQTRYIAIVNDTKRFFLINRDRRNRNRSLDKFENLAFVKNVYLRGLTSDDAIRFILAFFVIFLLKVILKNVFFPFLWQLS